MNPTTTMSRRPPIAPLALVLLLHAACARDAGRSARDSAGAAEGATTAAVPTTPAVEQPASPLAPATRAGGAPALANAGGAGAPAVRPPGGGAVPATGGPAAPAADTPSATAAPEATAPAADERAPSTAPSAAAPADPSAEDAPAPEARRPFKVGERLEYDVRFGPVKVGSASMEVRGLEEVRGQRAYHTVFDVRGGNALYRVDDHYESWFAARNLASLRYAQQIDEGSYERERRFEIYPERAVFREAGKTEDEPSVKLPLDDASFLYFLRTVPLEIGKSYTYDRYFRPDRNPVTVHVLRREKVKVPAGEFDAIVVQPAIKTKGIFSEGGRAEVWFADDSTRRILQIRSRLKFGSLSLHLR